MALRRMAAAVVAGLLAAVPAGAQELKIGLMSEATSADPHFHNLGPNNALRRHIFEALIETDETQQLLPGLAESWRNIDDTTWEFKLKKGVTFSNGAPFTARDVIYTFCRIPTVENSPSSFVVFIRDIQSVEVVDDHTLRFKTANPAPLLPINLASVGILSATVNNAGADLAFARPSCPGLGTPPRSTDFANPQIAVGTGAFRLGEYTRGAQIVLTRNPTHHGTKPHWERVVFRPIPSDGPRVAALLAGDVDFIETPPTQDFDRVKRAGFEIVQALSNRIIYLHMDQFGGEGWRTPQVSGTDGRNPFRDRRVRLAVSKAINRSAIVERIMGGVAQPAAELLPYPLFGTSRDARVEAFDPDGARRLLAEAGFPNGFDVVLGTPNDRYINDERIAQAVAQMLTRIGIRTTVDAVTFSTWVQKRNRFEYSFYLGGWGADTGEMSNPLVALVATPNPQTGMGNTNRGRYSNPEMDAIVIEARRTIDNAKRAELLQRASRLVMDDVGIIPLHFEVSPWAFRRTMTYKPRTDQYTLATGILPVAR